MRNRNIRLLSCLLVISMLAFGMVSPGNAGANNVYDYHMSRKTSDALLYTSLGLAAVLVIAAYGLLIWRTAKDNQEKSGMESLLGLSGPGLGSFPERHQAMIQPVFYIHYAGAGFKPTPAMDERAYGLGFQKRF